MLCRRLRSYVISLPADTQVLEEVAQEVSLTLRRQNSAQMLEQMYLPFKPDQETLSMIFSPACKLFLSLLLQTHRTAGPVLTALRARVQSLPIPPLHSTPWTDLGRSARDFLTIVLAFVILLTAIDSVRFK
jgi:hypothetical protein